MSIINQLAELGSQKMGVTVDELVAAESFDDLGLDSLALLEFNVAIQKSYAISLEDEEIAPEHSLRDVAELVETRKASDLHV
ncbi:MAG: acyl carrier protein [Rhodococcus sp.]|nr:acyl carrier protein [Rhodococcus sp. (in: high G+C Gram-positive bacteria)]